MARRGPKPKHLTLLDAADAVSVADLDALGCPIELDARQSELWSNIVRQLRVLGLEREIFWPTVADLVIALATLEACNRDMTSVTVRGDNSAEKKHPAWTIMNQAMTQIRTCSAELGLTPSALAKIGPKQPENPSELDRLIGGV